MKILIVSVFFPPQNTIASHRPYSWAKWWSREGHEITVLTTVKKTTHLDLKLPVEGYEVIEVPVPFLSKPHSKETGRKEAARAPSQNGFIKRLLQRVQKRFGILYGVRFPDFNDLWAASALKKVQSASWDLVVTTSGPYSVFKIGYELKKRGRANQWLMDYRDLWVDNHNFPGLPIFRSYERWLEKRYLQHVDFVTTVSDPLGEVLKRKTGKPVHTIYNGYDADDYSLISEERFFPDDNIKRIVYTGSFYTHMQNPALLFRALSELAAEGKVSSDKLIIVFAGDSGNINDLAAHHKCERFVQTLGLIPREDALRMQRDAAALLFLETKGSKANGILTGKLFEYLFAKKLILGVGVSEESIQGQIMKSSGFGMTFRDDVGALKQCILRIVSEELQNGPVNTEYIAQFSRRCQAEKLMGLISQS